MLGVALCDVDILITTGGVSVDPHDHARPALAPLGYRAVFAGVKLKPGRPTTFAVGRAAHCVRAAGQSGHGADGLRLFVVPALDAMLARGAQSHPLRATADKTLTGAVGRTTVVRCHTSLQDDGWHVRPIRSPTSHIPRSMVYVDALALVPEHRELISAGEPVAIELAGE